MEQKRRWLVLLAPLVLPWVIVSWGDGWYVLFSAFWVDPGPRFVTMIEFLSQTTYSLSSRNIAITWPLSFGLYLVGLVAAGAFPERRALPAPLWLLAGLGLGFYALGMTSRSGLVAVPIGTLILWVAALRVYRDAGEGSVTGPKHET